MNTNRDIQAVHHILHLFETAKANSEVILDNIPGVFCVMDVEGNIFRGNERLASIFSVDQENVLGCSFKQLLSEENWLKFQGEISRLFTEGITDQRIEFELDLDRVTPVKSFIWYLSATAGGKKNNLKLVTVVGMDVTKLKQVTTERARMESELVVAKAVQETLLPEATTDYKNIRISGSYQSASECSGDWWYYTLQKDKFYFCIGDVTGHGVSSALVTGTARTCFSLMQLMGEPTPDQLASRLNQIICETTKSQKYMSMFFACIDVNTKVLTFANAGHLPMLHIRPKDGLVTKSDISMLSTGPTALLGSEVNSTYTCFSTKVATGDWLFFYTDGVVEMKLENGSFLGDRQMYKFLIQALSRSTDPKEVVRIFEDLLRVQRGKTPLADDVTFFFVQIM